MASKPETLPIEWRDDARPLFLCIQCDTEFSTAEARCPRCQGVVSQVHRCPRCARVVSAKHLRCPYCSEGFLKNDERSLKQAAATEGALAAQKQLIEARMRGQGRRVLWFCTAVFLTVFALAMAVQLYRPGPRGGPVVLGSSFVLHPTELRQSASLLSPAMGKVAPPAVVEILSVQRDLQGRDWFQIKWGQGTAWIPVDTLAPPKGVDAEGGYTLLRVSLADLSDPAELGDATQAVRLYRDRYPAERRGEELLWSLAEKERELGRKARDARALSGARKSYQELIRENGAYARSAAEALAGLSELPAAPLPAAAGPSGAGSAAPAAGGPGSWSVYNDKSAPRKFMLLDETEVSVVLSAKQPLKEGELVAGQIARAIVSNGDTVVPAGALCRVKVMGADGSAGKDWVELSLAEIQLGGQSYKVDATPVRLRLGQAFGRAHLLFRLRRSLVLAQ